MKRRLFSLACALALALGLQVSAAEVGEPVKIQSISAGNYHALAVDNGGNLWAWGWNTYGELGDPALDNSGRDSNGPFQSSPVKVMEDVAFASAGHSASAAIRTDGSLWCWGEGKTPEKRLDGVEKVCLGQSPDDGVAVTRDGSLLVWGENRLEMLGLEPSDVPVKVMEGVADAQLWGEGLYVLKTDGTLVSVFYDVTQPVHLLDQVEKIAVGNSLLLAIKTDGSLWGSYPYEPLVLMMEDVADMASGTGSNYIVKTDGTLWAQGSNQFGELGNGRPGESSEELVQILDNVVQVEVGDCWAMARKTDGTVWSWGYNGEGQLGIGGKGDGESIIGPIQSVPVQVVFDSAALQEDGVTAYPGVNFAVQVDGRWGHMSFYGLENELGYRSYYVRLRDLAAALAETGAAFHLSYDDQSGAIDINTGERYLSQTGDGDIPFVGEQTAQSGTSLLAIDGLAVEVDSITLTDSAGGGHTYFELRDLGQALDFNVRWDRAYRHDHLDVSGCILMETDRPYTGE